MIRSTNQEMGEYDLIREPDHIVRVWKEVEAALPAYWEKFVQSETKAAKGGKKRNSSTKALSEGAVLTRVFDEAVASFEKAAAIGNISVPLHSRNTMTTPQPSSRRCLAMCR